MKRITILKIHDKRVVEPESGSSTSLMMVKILLVIGNLVSRSQVYVKLVFFLRCKSVKC